MNVAVVILAAGSGRRLGLGPKAHVVLQGETFLTRIVDRSRKAGLGPLHVVGSALDSRIAAACTQLQARLVVNEDPSRGMSSSVHVGLLDVASASGGDAPAVVVFPVDFPLVLGSTLRDLRLAALLHPETWSRPCFKGESGHPVVLGANLASHVRTKGPHEPLREVLRVWSIPPVDVECEDRGIVLDIDEPGDLVAARSLAW